MPKNTFSIITALSSLLITSPAIAQNIDNPFAVLDAPGWTVGGGIAAETSIIEGVDDQILPFPYIAYDWEDWHLSIDGLSYDAIETDTIALNILLAPRFSLVDPSDNDRFKSIDRNEGIDAGISTEIALPLGNVSAMGLVDLTGAHNGYEFDVRYGIGVPIGSVVLDIGAGGTYRDENLNAYYFGVEADEATDSLAAYAPESSWAPYVDATAIWAVGERNFLLATVQYENLSDTVKDSPLVSESNSVSGMFAFIRKF